MLQYIIDHTDRYSAPELAQMAIEGGCRWIQLSPSLCAQSETALRELANEIIPLCREAEAFLVIENDVEMVADLKVHGVVLRDSTPSVVAAAREQLGAHAVIGVYVDSFEKIQALKGIDIDYILLPYDGSDAAGAEHFYASTAAKMYAGEIDFHLVALYNGTPEELASLTVAGCAGVAVSAAISDATDPVDVTAAILQQLEMPKN